MNSRDLFCVNLAFITPGQFTLEALTVKSMKLSVHEAIQY